MVVNILNEVRGLIAKKAVGLWSEAADLSFQVTEPDTEEHGDIATNAALALSKKVKKSPMEVADQLAAALRDEELFSKTEVAKPGFINFFLKDELLLKRIDVFLKNLGKFPSSKEKIVLEHTNVNPNKAMHIGHLRNAVLGDVINRIVQRVGYTTEVEYYVDDTGVQVADTFLGLKELKLKREAGEKYDHYCWRVYAAINESYAERPELLEKRTLILHELEKTGSETGKAVHATSEQIVEDHLATMGAFNIAYDLLAWERDILGFEFWSKAFELLKKSPNFVKETDGKNVGCWVIKSESDAPESDEHSPDKVIVKSDGTVTYTGKDIAYHLWKYDLLGADFLYSEWKKVSQKGILMTTDPSGKKSKAFGHADRVYNVIDVRQAYPQAMVKFALESLGHPKQASGLRHVSYGVVSLSQSTAASLGVEASGTQFMSGRKGIGIKIDDLVKAVEESVVSAKHEVSSERTAAAVGPREIATGAIKYFMLRYNPNTDIVFDLKEALSLQGNTGVYLQYAHARATGILEKAGVSRKKTAVKEAAGLSAEERRLLLKLYQWPQTIIDVSESLNVNDICTYAFELANTFNGFYEAQPVLKAEGAVREQRIALVKAFKTVLADVLGLLGIAAPEKM